MTDAETLKVYATKAQDYADLTTSEGQTNRRLAAFIESLPAGGQVLDLGCGPGTYSAVMAGAGLIVTATDAVPEMVKMAARHPNVTAQLASFDDISGTDLYDGIWANFSLLHAARHDMPRHLAALVTSLKLGGIFHIGLKTGTGSHRDALGRLYTYYTDVELTGLLGDAGLTVTDRTTGREKGLDGVYADWLVLRAYA